MYYKLPVKERIKLMKSYKKANPDMSYQDMVNDYNTSYQKFDNGGKLSYFQNKPQYGLEILTVNNQSYDPRGEFSSYTQPGPLAFVYPDNYSEENIRDKPVTKPTPAAKQDLVTEPDQPDKPVTKPVEKQYKVKERYQAFFPNPAKISTKAITPATTYVSGKEQNTLSSMPVHKRLLTQAKANAEAQRQYNTSKAILNMASFIPGPIGLGANISSGVVDFAEGNYGQGTIQGVATVLRNSQDKKAQAIKGLSDLLTVKELYDFNTQPEPSYENFLPYLTDEYKRELLKQKPLTVQKYGGVQKFGDGGKKQQTRTDLYTDKALFDKAYKAEQDSLYEYKEFQKYIKDGYVPVAQSQSDAAKDFRESLKRDKEKNINNYYYHPKGMSPNGIYWENDGIVYLGKSPKKPVVHNIYQEPEKEPKPFVKKWTDKVAYDQAVKAEMDSANRYNEYINKVKQYQKEGLELKKSFPVSNSILSFMNDPAFANSIYSKPIREEYYGNPTKSGNVTSQATALVYKKPVVHNVYEPVMTKPIQSSQDTVRHWNFNGPNPVLEYYDKSGKLINKEFYTNAGPGGKRIQPLNK